MHPFFIPWRAGTSRHGRLVRKHVPDSDPGWMVPATEFVIPAKAGIQRGRVAPTTPKHFQRPGLIFIPWCAGTSRHERLVRKHVPDSDPGWIPAPAGDTNHRRPSNDSRGPKERCSAGACPQPAGSGGRPATVTTAPTSSFRRRPESRGGIGGRHQFSYLGVPAATGAGDSYGTLPSLD